MSSAATASTGSRISGNLGSFNQILGNFIGTDPSQSFNNGNGDGGVFITDGSANTIGGTSMGAGNVITNNGATLGLKGFGVTVASGSEDAIRGNSIYANGGRGIDLGNNPALRFNIPGGGTSGPNNQENYPVETAVQQVPGFNIITWTLNSTPSSSFDIDFFANSMLTESGFGDGQYYLYSEHITTDASGNATFLSFILSNVQVHLGHRHRQLGQHLRVLDGEFRCRRHRGLPGRSKALTSTATAPSISPCRTPHRCTRISMWKWTPWTASPRSRCLPTEEPDIPDDLQTGTYLDLVVAAFYDAPVSDPDGIDWHQPAHRVRSIRTLPDASMERPAQWLP